MLLVGEKERCPRELSIQVTRSLLYNIWNFSFGERTRGGPYPVIAKLIYFFVLANVVWGSWMFYAGMDPILKTNFMFSSLLLAYAFYVWGRYLFRKRTIHE